MPPTPPPQDPTSPTAVQQVTAELLAPADGAEYTLAVRGDCMRPAGVFDGDWVILRRQDHAQDGEIVVAQYPGQPPGMCWLGLKHFHRAGLWVRLEAMPLR